jgi:hypothetical protein
VVRRRSFIDFGVGRLLWHVGMGNRSIGARADVEEQVAALARDVG